MHAAPWGQTTANSTAEAEVPAAVREALSVRTFMMDPGVACCAGTHIMKSTGLREDPFLVVLFSLVRGMG